MFSFFKTPDYEKARSLNAKASELIDKKELEKALGYLKKAHWHYIRLEGCTISSKVRYPLYLQKTRYYDTAIAVFQEVLNAQKSLTQPLSHHLNDYTQKRFLYLSYTQILDKMRLVAQREKDFQIAIYYNLLSKGANLFAEHLGLKGVRNKKEKQYAKEALDRIFNSQDYWEEGLNKLMQNQKRLKQNLINTCEVFGNSVSLEAFWDFKRNIENLLSIKTTEATKL